VLDLRAVDPDDDPILPVAIHAALAANPGGGT
jgi:hypothetical protein